MKTATKVRSVGGSLMITIPKIVAEAKGLQPGDMVTIDVERTKKSFLGVFKGIGSFTQEDEMKAHE